MTDAPDRPEESSARPEGGPEGGPHGASSQDARDPLLLLTAPYESLGLAERAVALVEARESGRRAAAHAGSLEELESAPTPRFCDYLVDAALESGLLGPAEAAAWRRVCDTAAALRDPRVQAFFFGWHERGTELMAELAAGEGDEELRARWFLRSLRP